MAVYFGGDYMELEYSWSQYNQFAKSETCRRFHRKPVELTVEENESINLQFVEYIRAGTVVNISPGLVRALVKDLQHPKASAELERIFKVMRQLRGASEHTLQDVRLAKRTRLSSNLPIFFGPDT